MKSQNTRNSKDPRENAWTRLAAIYREVDMLLDGHSCDNSTECCRFGITGREPYVTPIEVSYLREELRKGGKGLPGRGKRALPLHAPNGRDSQDERTCPLLSVEGRCVAYAARPFGCRTFFCERRQGPSKFPRTEVRELLGALSSLSEETTPADAKARPLTRTLLGA